MLKQKKEKSQRVNRRVRHQSTKRVTTVQPAPTRYRSHSIDTTTQFDDDAKSSTFDLSFGGSPYPVDRRRYSSKNFGNTTRISAKVSALNKKKSKSKMKRRTSHASALDTKGNAYAVNLAKLKKERKHSESKAHFTRTQPSSGSHNASRSPKMHSKKERRSRDKARLPSKSARNESLLPRSMETQIAAPALCSGKSKEKDLKSVLDDIFTEYEEGSDACDADDAQMQPHDAEKHRPLSMHRCDVLESYLDYLRYHFASCSTCNACLRRHRHRHEECTPRDTRGEDHEAIEQIVNYLLSSTLQRSDALSATTEPPARRDVVSRAQSSIQRAKRSKKALRARSGQSSRSRRTSGYSHGFL